MSSSEIEIIKTLAEIIQEVGKLKGELKAAKEENERLREQISHNNYSLRQSPVQLLQK